MILHNSLLRKFLNVVAVAQVHSTESNADLPLPSTTIKGAEPTIDYYY